MQQNKKYLIIIRKCKTQNVVRSDNGGKTVDIYRLLSSANLDI